MDELSPHIGQHLWNRPHNGEWMFRGQSEAVWSLTPRALRADAFKGFVAGQIQMPPYTFHERLGLERSVVNEFAGLISRFGFEIPDDAQDLRDRETSELRTVDGIDFPPLRERAIHALAQHYGVPTRLLDWSGRPLYAAYFAAADAAEPGRKPPPNSDGRMAIWAVQSWFIEEISRKWEPGAVLVTAPTVSNPNLHAQMGAFTLVRYQFKYADGKQPPDGLNPPDLDALFKIPANIENARAQRPMPGVAMMLKFTLPQSEAGKLLGYLDLQDVNRASVYPGRHSIVPYMLEANKRMGVRPPERR